MASDSGDSDKRILALFDGAGPVETPAAGVKAWIAYDTVSEGRPVLIKRLPGAAKGRATEALALRHANIIPPRRWLGDSGYIYVVREVRRGKNLRQALAASSGSRPSPELFRRLFLPIIAALGAAHARGVTHGGVSPENIIVGDEGEIFLCDFATADPKATNHLAAYNGKATIAGDIKALSRVLATYLPNAGPFASLAVRGRLEGLLNRCDSLSDLRDTVEMLERLAASSAPATAPPLEAKEKTGGSSPLRDFPGAATPALPTLKETTGDIAPVLPPQRDTLEPPPALEATLVEKMVRIAQGGGGAATLTIKNNGKTPMVIRLIATQHAWLNPRPLELPLALAPGAAEKIGLNISAARLTPGDYRSEVYLFAALSGAGATDPGFKHTSELRVSVESAGLPTAAPPDAKPPYPANAPTLPGSPGCGVIAAALTAAFWGVGFFLYHFLGASQLLLK